MALDPDQLAKLPELVPRPGEIIVDPQAISEDAIEILLVAIAEALAKAEHERLHYE
jgi:hypothetical protein